MNTIPLLHQDEIDFATMRPPGSKSAVLERQIVVTAPPEAVTLSQSNDLQVVEQLIEALGQPQYAWAAEVMLAAMTGRESKSVESFAATPDDWVDTLGKNAQTRWSEWFEASRDKLNWDADKKMFIEVE